MIEDIILQYSGQRNITKLRKYLPQNFCEQAADMIMQHPGKVLITTGFWVGGAYETDGPDGAIVLADAVQTLGSEPVFVTDPGCAEILRQCRSYRAIAFPIMEYDESRQFARALLAQESPSLLISIERCGMAHDGCYYTMHRQDISAHTAKVDYLFLEFPVSIGIGDGGNEIGMGNLTAEIEREGLPITPCATKVQHVVIATVSDWAAYGIVAYLSRKRQQDLLQFSTIRAIIEQLVALGVVDGVTRQPEASVDGFSLDVIESIVNALLEK